MDSKPYTQSDAHLRGVGGWLIVLILGLTFIAPFWQLRIASHAFKRVLSPESLAQFAVFRLSIIVAIYAGLAVFSFVSGILLWSNNRRAPNVTKAYLIISVLAISVLLSSHRLAGFELDLPRILFNRAAYGCFWYAYLVRSRRVRLTYFEEVAITPGPSPSSPVTA
jgi:hypothetical protein